jgi:hypothetical protein
MEWHAPLLPTRSRLCAFRYTVRACYTSWVQTIPYISRCGASSATPRREIACTGRLLAAEHSSGALPAFRHSLGSHCPRCVSRTSVPVTHKTEARVRILPQAVAMEHLDAVSPSPPVACARVVSSNPPSHPTVTYRVPPSGHTPLGSGGATVPILSERSALSPGKRLHHQ